MKVIFDFHEIDSLSIAGSQLDHLYLREWHFLHVVWIHFLDPTPRQYHSPCNFDPQPLLCKSIDAISVWSPVFSVRGCRQHSRHSASALDPWPPFTLGSLLPQWVTPRLIPAHVLPFSTVPGREHTSEHVNWFKPVQWERRLHWQRTLTVINHRGGLWSEGVCTDVDYLSSWKSV